MSTHQDFFEMAESIFQVTTAEGIGIVPYDNPSTMEFGYMAALPHSKRQVHHYWSVSITEIKKAYSDPRYHEVQKRLQDLAAQARAAFDAKWASKNT